MELLPSLEFIDIDAQNAEMRAAITAAIADLRGRHADCVCEDRRCDECRPDALLADRLTAALGEGRGTEGEEATRA